MKRRVRPHQVNSTPEVNIKSQAQALPPSCRDCVSGEVIGDWCHCARGQALRDQYYNSKRQELINVRAELQRQKEEIEFDRRQGRNQKGAWDGWMGPRHGDGTPLR